MRVLFLTNIPVPYRISFFNKLGSMCDLTVLFERKDAINRDKSWLQNTAKSFQQVFLKGYNVGSDNALCFGVLKYINRFRNDRIIVGGYSTPTGILSIIYLRFMKIDFYINCDGGFIKQEKRYQYLLKRFLLSSATAWLSSSVETDKYLIHYGAISDNIFRYSFTSLNKSDITLKLKSREEKMILREKLHLNSEIMIITVGQFIKRKGIDILLETARNLEKNIHIFVVGGYPTPEYIDYIDKNNIKNVFFIPFLTKEDLSKYYDASDLFVLPTREDIWGLVVNEAMAHGLPVITTNRCLAGLELIVNGYNGFIIPINNSFELTDKINTIVNDDKYMHMLSIKSLLTIKSYTIENMAIQHLEILKSKIGAKK